MLIADDGYAKLADFGLSRENVTGDRDIEALAGTAEYIAPEALAFQGYGKATDWWSLGVLIYELLCAQQPFQGTSKQNMFDAI